MTYRASRLESRCAAHVVRGVRYNVRRWGRDDDDPILMLHGTQDSSITFQFVVEALRGRWCVIAPDWRGHGLSERAAHGYWFHDFVADLDCLFDNLFGGRAVPIVGHSLGGNIAGVYAGLRPQQVASLVSLDGFGPLTNRLPVDVASLLIRFLDMPKRTREHSVYPSLAAVADRLQRANPRLSPEQAEFLAEHSSAADADGRRRWLFDPAHQVALPSLHSMEEWGRIWSGVVAPTLWISSSDPRPHAPTSAAGEMERRKALAPNLTHVSLRETGHNLHHDAPERVADLMERFIAGRELAGGVAPQSKLDSEYSGGAPHAWSK